MDHHAQDAPLTARELEHRYGTAGEHPELAHEDWRDAVATGSTLAGYWDWVAHVLTRSLDWGEPA